MPERKQPQSLPKIPHDQEEQTSAQEDQSTEDEAEGEGNWSDEATATKSDESRDFVSKPRARVNFRRPPPIRRHRRSPAVKDTWNDTAGDNHDYCGYQASYPGGQIAAPYARAPLFPPPPARSPLFQPPNPGFRGSYYSDRQSLPPHPPPPHPPPPYFLNPHPSDPQSPNPHSYYPNPTNDAYPAYPTTPYQASSHPANPFLPKPVVPSYGPDFQQKPKLPAFHLEHEMDVLKRELDALKMDKIRQEEERQRAQRKEKYLTERREQQKKNREKFDQEVERRVQAVKAELEKQLTPRRDARNREIRSDSGGRRLDIELREILQDLAAERQMEDSLHMRDERGIEWDRLQLLGLRQMADDKFRRQGGRRSYEGSVRDSLVEQSRGRLDIIPRWPSQSNPDEDIHSHLKRLVVDVVREVQGTETAFNRLLAQSLAPTAQPSHHPSENNGVAVDWKSSRDYQPSNYGGSSGMPSPSSPADQPRSRNYQPSNYGGSSGLPSPSSHVTADNFNHYSVSDHNRFSSYPQNIPHRTPTFPHDGRWDHTSAPNFGAFQEQVGRNMNSGDGYFPTNARSDNSWNAPNGVGGRRPEPAMAPNNGHAWPRGKPHTRAKRDRRQDSTHYSAKSGGLSSDDFDDEDCYPPHISTPYALNHQDLDDPTHVLPPKVPDAPQPSSKNNPKKFPVELRDCLDPMGRLHPNDQLSGRGPSMRTPQTTGPVNGNPKVVV